MTTKDETDTAAWKCFRGRDHVMRLSTLQFFHYLHALPGKNSLYTLDDDGLLDLGSSKQLQTNA